MASQNSHGMRITSVLPLLSSIDMDMMSLVFKKSSLVFFCDSFSQQEQFVLL